MGFVERIGGLVGIEFVVVDVDVLMKFVHSLKARSCNSTFFGRLWLVGLS